MMNLADIRKKAQTAELPGDQPVAPWQAPLAAPGPPDSCQPGVPTAPAAYSAPPEPCCAASPAEPELDPEPENFDPAAVILKGRQSAAFEEVSSLKEDQADASVELLCFRVATEEYAISIMDIKEIIKPREVTEVPRVPSFVRGILSLRGNIIPIFDMRVRLGLPGATASERERVVVVKRQGGFCGVLVDEVVQVVRIAEAGIEPPPVVLEGIDRDFVQGIGRVGGRMLILLDMEKVLDVSLL
ncbi:MAG: chemotaxis protein CheW [Geobacteraceae bacterium GWC2_58_44]|nr:MAG: chemotaxis protein CheW [Geobacteraceae bacterium GWC2_58_44]